MAAFTSSSFILASFLLAIATLQLSPASSSSSSSPYSLEADDLPPPDGVIIAESDLQALMAVKSALVDPLNILQSWNSSSYGGACGGSWVGVKCAKGQVIALQLASKALGGSLSEQIGQLFALRKLNLHSNSIHGAIPASLSMIPNLRGLYLNRNQFSGSIPPGLANSPYLQRIDLSHNSLSGLIPAFVVVSSNSTSISAQSSSSSSSGSKLYFIDLSYNNFSSAALSASSFASLPSLLELRISHSSLQGSVASALTNPLPSLSILDLSHNDLNGSLPQLALSNLTFLDLSFNALTGSISADLLANFTSLHTLNLSNNGLSSTIPAAIGNLTSLQSLDLSVNSFNGSLPPSLADLKNLTSFNCSFNNLTGGVPEFAHRFDKSSFAGNEGLCGYDASVACAFQSPPPSSPWISSNPSDSSNATSSLTPNPDQSGARRRRFSRATFLVIVIGSVAAGVLLICLISALLCIFCRHMGSSSTTTTTTTTTKRDDMSSTTKTKTNSGADSSNADEYGAQKFNSGRISSGGKEKDSYGSGGGGGEVGGGKLVHFDGSLRFTADGLLCATAEVLGKSTYGTVYKATFEDGSEVAVKRLREGVVKSQRDFEMEVNVLGKIRHPNLLSLRGYYWGPKNEKLLIFDFMPGGSLSAFLHARGPETPLTWHTRLNIAAGAARGLAHLHATEHIIHGNLTAGNILLDARMNSKLSDFGLSRLMTSAANANVIATATALGYRAPELTKLRKATTRSDVYSFGVVLLELLTGKSPAEATSGDQTAGMDLPEWVASIVKEEWTNEIFDLELMKGSAPTEDELINTLQLAMNCVAPSPGSRPSMEEISRHLDETLGKPDQHQHMTTTTSSDSSAV